jgi:uncharacterized protein
MPESPWFPAVLVVLSVVCLRAWIGFFRAMSAELPPPDARNPMVCRFGIPDAIFAAFLCLFFLLMIFSDTGEVGEINRQVLINGMLFYATLLMAMTSFLLLRGINPLEIFGLGPAPTAREAYETIASGQNEAPVPPPGTLRSAVGFGLLWLVLAYPILMLAQMVSYHIAGLETPPQEILLFLIEKTDFADRFAVLVLAILVAPVAEEFVFRGYLYGVAKKYGGRWCAIGTTSLLFAAIHLHLPSFAGLFLLGCLLALVYERTRRLWVPILMHMVFNAVSVGVALLWPDVLP